MPYSMPTDLSILILTSLLASILLLIPRALLLARLDKQRDRQAYRGYIRSLQEAPEQDAARDLFTEYPPQVKRRTETQQATDFNRHHENSSFAIPHRAARQAESNPCEPMRQLWARRRYLRIIISHDLSPGSSDHHSSMNRAYLVAPQIAETTAGSGFLIEYSAQVAGSESEIRSELDCEIYETLLAAQEKMERVNDTVGRLLSSSGYPVQGRRHQLRERAHEPIRYQVRQNDERKRPRGLGNHRMQDIYGGNIESDPPPVYTVGSDLSHRNPLERNNLLGRALDRAETPPTSNISGNNLSSRSRPTPQHVGQYLLLKLCVIK